MNWYKRFKFSQIQGEYWITDSGQVMGADGDIGDYNHESYVIQSILGSYDMDYESNMVDIEDPAFLENFVTENFEECVDLLVQQGNIKLEEVEALLEDPVTNHEEVVSQIAISDVMKIKGASDDEIEVVSGYMDARSFAMANWGWKRLEGDHVETWTLTPGDMDTIASGLYEAYGEVLEGSGEDETFIIHVHGNDKVIEMTYGQISRREVGESAQEKLHRQVQDKQFEEQDKPSNPFYKDWN